MLKKILPLIGFILAVVVLTFSLYLVFYKPPKIVPVKVEKPEEVITKPSKLPVTKEVWERMTIEERVKAGLPLYSWPEEKRVFPVVEEKPVSEIPEISEIASGGKTWVSTVSLDRAQNFALSPDGRFGVYYNKKEGKFYQIDRNGQKRLLTDKTFHQVEKVNWSPTRDKAILEYPDGFKILYDFEKNKQYSLPKNWQDFSWSPNGEKIAFKSLSKYPDNNWLAISNPDGSDVELIEHLGENADKVIVSFSPNNQVIAFSATGRALGSSLQEILLIGQHNENFKSLVVDGYGFEPEWSPTGKKIAYSVYNPSSGYRPTLYIVNAQGEEIGSNHINTGLNTWAHKCVFNSNESYLYCAVPRELKEGAGMIKDLASHTEDDFYKINTLTGEVTFLAEGATGGYDVEKLFLSPDESFLYFVDEYTGLLHYIRLK
jgi:hypothetical protein